MGQTKTAVSNALPPRARPAVRRPGQRRHAEARSASIPPVPAADFTALRRLLWLYFILLVFEGALRKWLLPQWGKPLLIVRDPVVLGIYWLALRQGIFPWNGFVVSTLGISLLTLAASLIVDSSSLLTLLYGWRANFLHLPLVFIIPVVFTIEDVRKLGWWTLWLMLPMALLMVVQFQSAPDAWVNAGARGEFQQIGAAREKIRPPGTFSFITGVVDFFGLAAGFLFFSMLAEGVYPLWLVTISGLGLLLGMAVSGSRSVVLTVLEVLAAFAVCFFRGGKPLTKTAKVVFVGGVIAAVLGNLTIIHDGIEVLVARFTESESGSAVAVGLLTRVFSDYVEPLGVVSQVPFLGDGLGRGTNVGASLLRGGQGVLLVENEWSRILMESGPLFGGAFILLRIALTAWLGARSVRAIAAGNPLPLLLFAPVALEILQGNFGQPAILGFAVFAAGLCLAAQHNQTSEDDSPRPFHARKRGNSLDKPVGA